MKKGKRKIAGADAERALFHTLKDETLLPPTSEEEIAALEEELGLFPDCPAVTGEVVRLLREGLPDPAPTGGLLGDQIERSLAQAARHGQVIPPEVLDLMKHDREQAEGEKDSS